MGKKKQTKKDRILQEHIKLREDDTLEDDYNKLKKELKKN